MIRRAIGACLVLAACAPAPPPVASTAAAGQRQAADANEPDSQLTPEPTRAREQEAATAASPPPGCRGHISSEVQRQLSERAAESRVCYERLLLRDPTRHGRVMVSVRLSGPGRFDSAQFTRDEIGDQELERCVLANFQVELGTPIEGECADVNIPLRFELKKPAPALPLPLPPPSPSGAP